MQKELYTDGYQVNCRIGSLEKKFCSGPRGVPVNCRIGSLEKVRRHLFGGKAVNCRIGSLEISVW